MRKLYFKITAQTLEVAGDTSGLVPGTEGYLMAHFEFSTEWDKCVKVASFFDRKGKEYPVSIVNDECIIPKEVLVDKIFKVKVIGGKTNFFIPTNTLIIKQKG